jgi:uncharacterized protein (UPF0248 family)
LNCRQIARKVLSLHLGEALTIVARTDRVGPYPMRVSVKQVDEEHVFCVDGRIIPLDRIAEIREGH